ncbi:hypothetical protein M2322_004777 [Rhodoblastus acidophilus]|uniref:hypothetical protein n=1 Tax=Rhodoblastus acidophilus TaxID=1074 RepID=UPI00222427CF|nr:hypothetical protein [Rhodoblastus acidophilus]MCW2319208.1 hypothetical protein [Rhodoblastus acidophilus]
MTQEFEAANERTIKVELHLHLSVAGEPRPDWSGAAIPYAAPRMEPVKPRHWLRKSFTLVSVFIVGAFGASFVHRVLETSTSRTDVAAIAPLQQLPASVDLPTVVPQQAAQGSASGADANPAGGNVLEASRRGTGAFGLH